MENFDAVVVGAGHAGCESALALSRMGQKTLLLTLSLDAISFLACNPSIGGTAKGHLVCEIDALGGQMGIVADKTLLQIRMLNKGKGPAVQSLRAQTDKNKYHQEMKKIIENTDNLFLKQGEVCNIEDKGEKKIIYLTNKEIFSAKAVVVATGVYLKSQTITGELVEDVGPNGFKRSNYLSNALEKLGVEMLRFKTGTPARINSRSVDFSCLSEQEGEDEIQNFSFLTKKKRKNTKKCYLTYTNTTTHKIINDNLYQNPTISGEIKGVGPRYCPSIETKIVRFADKEKHQLFLEPEAENTNEVYVQGLSTSMPADVQKQIIHSIKGLENAEIMRDAYAIEYDCINPLQLLPTLESKSLKGLFFAGQINGTSGYEEAGAQGIIAGINAARYIQNKEPLILKRNEAYIGVLIDDIVTKGTNEPYRMMTSRAEYRLILRQDNADIRLTEKGREVGLVDDKRYKVFKSKMKKIEEIKEILKIKIKNDEKMNNYFIKNNENPSTKGMTVKDIIKRSNLNLFNLNEEYNLFDKKTSFDIVNQVNIMVKFEGYIKQQEEEILKFKRNENIIIPEDFDYFKIKGIRQETQQKLSEVKPLNIGQASRISGISPADISILTVFVKKTAKNQ